MRKRLFSLAMTAAIVAAACGSSATPVPTKAPTAAPATAAPTTAATAAPVNYEDVLFKYSYEPKTGKAGGSAVVGNWQTPKNLNNYYDNTFATSQVLAAAMLGLWEVTSDGHYRPSLAAKMPKFSDKSIRAAADGSFEVDLELLPDLKWSDGKPLTMADVKYTYEWIMSPDQTGLAGGKSGWEDISSFTVSADGLKATVKFKKAYAGFYGLFSSMVLPKHYFETIPVKEASQKSMPLSPAIKNVPASGPFMFDTATSDSILLKKNPSFKGGVSKSGAYLDSVTMQFFANKDSMIAAYLAGSLDLALNLLASDYAAINKIDPAKGKAIIEPAWQYEHLDFNMGSGGHPMLADVNVRKAIHQAIDKADLYKAIFPGYPVPDPAACSPAPPGTYWRDATIKCLPFDEAAAKAGLTAAGWTDSNSNGTIDKGGKEAVLEACTSAGNATRKLTLEKIAGYLQKVGIKVNVNLVDSTKILFASWNDVAATDKCSIYRGTYDLALFAWVLTFDLFGNYFYSYHSSQHPDLPPNDGINNTRFKNADMDKALETLRDSIKTEDQVKAALVVQKVYVENFPEIPLYYRSEARGVSNRLGNYFKNPSTSSDIWNIEDWYIQ